MQDESTGVNRWSAAQLEFQAWLALPPGQRHPRQQKQLAGQLGVSEETLCRWKREPGFGDAVYELAFRHVSGELVPILHAQTVQARKGSLAHAQWLFDLAGKWSPRQKHEHSGPGGRDLVISVVYEDRASSAEAAPESAADHD